MSVEREPSMDEEKGDYYDDATSTTSTPLFHEPEQETPSRRRQQQQQRSLASRCPTILHWASHLLSAIAMIYLAIRVVSRDTTLECFDRFNAYTPMREFVKDNPYIEGGINGSKLYQSDFVGEASEKTEDAWRTATEYGLLSMTKGEVEKVGYPDWSAQFPKTARPDEGYPVVVVGNHQLHCLHYIWQDHHLDYYTHRAAYKQSDPVMYEGHYEHCIDFLRQRLMCHYDMSVTPYQWVKGHQAPMPGAMTNEKCVNWEAMRTWMKDNIPETPDDFIWQIPEGAVELESDP
ncbi:hypothetical protein DOTSEDRAFT_67614 [Dothistroma septosporum NZE10]|uniref:Tat pathway signal sequence n=1 Tax=Dothistroma septosporum (strain NZE10 / CBS 128990) TaxID=675120 RepID=N1Q1Y5_DOTSN|nr:hypothetical protein DOTSEDRAFT_67614 [Dothistroma septosporum NZE10]